MPALVCRCRQRPNPIGLEEEVRERRTWVWHLIVIQNAKSYSRSLAIRNVHILPREAILVSWHDSLEIIPKSSEAATICDPNAPQPITKIAIKVRQICWGLPHGTIIKL